MTRDVFLEKLYEVLDEAGPHQLSPELMKAMEEDQGLRQLYEEVMAAEEALCESYTGEEEVSPKLHDSIMKRLEDAAVLHPPIRSFSVKWIAIAAAVLVAVSVLSFLPLFQGGGQGSAPTTDPQVADAQPTPIPDGVEIPSISLSALFKADLYTPLNNEVRKQEEKLKGTRAHLEKSTNSLLKRTVVVVPGLSSLKINSDTESLFKKQEENAGQSLYITNDKSVEGV